MADIKHTSLEENPNINQLSNICVRDNSNQCVTPIDFKYSLASSDVLFVASLLMFCLSHQILDNFKIATLKSNPERCTIIIICEGPPQRDQIHHVFLMNTTHINSYYNNI